MVNKLLLTFCLIVLFSFSLISAELVIGDANEDNKIVELITDIPLNVTTGSQVFNMSEFWITDEGNLDNVPDILHSDLSNLAWSVAGHTIDTNVDFDDNDLHNIDQAYFSGTDFISSDDNGHIDLHADDIDLHGNMSTIWSLSFADGGGGHSNLFFGSNKATHLYYNGSDFIINPDNFGSGRVFIEGDVFAENIYVPGFINGINISNFNNSYLTLSGGNANQNIDISQYSLTANNVNASFFNWTSGDTWNLFDGQTLTFNSSKLSTQYFNTSTIEVVTGTPQGTIQDIRSNNNVPYNLSEVTSDLELRINFTDIDDFTTLIIDYRSVEEDEPHILRVQLWDYDKGDWEDHDRLVSVGTYVSRRFGILDSSRHVGEGDNDGVVQVRIYQDEGVPAKTHKHNFDWIALSKGFGTPAGEDVLEGWLENPLFQNNVDGSAVNSSWDMILANNLNVTGDISTSYTTIYQLSDTAGLTLYGFDDVDDETLNIFVNEVGAGTFDSSVAYSLRVADAVKLLLSADNIWFYENIAPRYAATKYMYGDVGEKGYFNFDGTDLQFVASTAHKFKLIGYTGFEVNNITVSDTLKGYTRVIELDNQIVINPDFADGDDWTLDGSWAVANGFLGISTTTPDEDADGDLNETLDDGETYRVTFDILTNENTGIDPDGAWAVSLGSGTGQQLIGEGTGSKSYDLVAGVTNELITFSAIASSGGVNYVVDNVQVRKILRVEGDNVDVEHYITADEFIVRSGIYDREKYGDPFQYLSSSLDLIKKDELGKPVLDDKGEVQADDTLFPEFVRTGWYDRFNIWHEGILSFEFSTWVMEMVYDLKQENIMLKEELCEKDDCVNKYSWCGCPEL